MFNRKSKEISSNHHTFYSLQQKPKDENSERKCSTRKTWSCTTPWDIKQLVSHLLGDWSSLLFLRISTPFKLFLCVGHFNDFDACLMPFFTWEVGDFANKKTINLKSLQDNASPTQTNFSQLPGNRSLIFNRKRHLHSWTIFHCLCFSIILRIMGLNGRVWTLEKRQVTHDACSPPMRHGPSRNLSGIERQGFLFQSF